MLSAILDLFFPKRCVGCRKLGIYFCKGCITNISQGDLICPMCQKSSVGGQTHPLCQRKYGLDGLWSLGLYKNPLREAIIQLKYKDVQEISKILVDLVVEYWAKYQPFILEQIKKDQGQVWAIVPVPLHSYRKNWRGYNQTELLAMDLAKRFGLDYLPALKRIHLTKPQVKLKGIERRMNLKNVFSFNSEFKIHNSKILIIDDVWTTGSTLKECCFMLKKAGVKQVWAITLAR